jgi:hypothetical protein
MAGARVVFIDWKSTDDQIRQKMSKLNGILLAGGGMDFEKGEDFSDFLLKSKVIYDETI